MRSISLVLLFVVGCLNPDFTVKNVDVYDYGTNITAERIGVALDIFDYYFENSSSYYDYLAINLSPRPVHWYGSSLDYYGLQDGMSIYVYIKSNCLSGSALFHEMAHWYDEIVIKVPTDYFHENLYTWERVAYANQMLQASEVDCEEPRQ